MVPKKSSYYPPPWSQNLRKKSSVPKSKIPYISLNFHSGSSKTCFLKVLRRAANFFRSCGRLCRRNFFLLFRPASPAENFLLPHMVPKNPGYYPPPWSQKNTEINRGYPHGPTQLHPGIKISHIRGCQTLKSPSMGGAMRDVSEHSRDFVLPIFVYGNRHV